VACPATHARSAAQRDDGGFPARCADRQPWHCSHYQRLLLATFAFLQHLISREQPGYLLAEVDDVFDPDSGRYAPCAPRRHTLAPDRGDRILAVLPRSVA
jgi:hypothetical protein